MKEGHDDTGALPDNHPHVRLYREVTPLWHEGESPEELDARLGGGYCCGFSGGFESGILMTVMKPEWAFGWFQRLRLYYLANQHTPENLEDWERCADATVRAIPIQVAD